MIKPTQVLLCSMLLAIATWAANGQAQKTKVSRSSGHATARIARLDACALLTSADIQAVQGEPVKETKPSTQPGGGMLISQCLFRTATSAKSVTLTLAAPDPADPSALTPRRFWQQQFHAGGSEQEKKPSGDEAAKKSEPEGETEKQEPFHLSGIGEEAYWVGNRMTGAMYVLQGDLYLRISAGGIPDEVARLDKTETLARAALKRVPVRKSNRALFQSRGLQP